MKTLPLPLPPDKPEPPHAGQVRRHDHPGRPRIDGPGHFVNYPSKMKRLDYYKEQDRLRARKLYAARREWRDAVKAQLGCQICGEAEPCCLEFHHIDPQTFAFTIAHISTAKAKLIDEIAKCTIVCRNCHRKIHDGVIPVPTFEPIAVETLPELP